MKKFIALVLLLALAGAGWYFYQKEQVQAKEVSAKEDRRFTAKALREDIRITVSASGRVEPEREVEIKSKASGEVINVYADVSDEVKQGMLLFKLDPTDEERNVAKLKANLSMSQAKLQQVKLAVRAAEAKLEADRMRVDADVKSADAERSEYASRYTRAEQLYQQKVITREDLDTAYTRMVQTESALANARLKDEDLEVQALELERTRQEIPIAEAQVDNDNVALADAQQRLKDTNIFSPIDGVVSARSIQEGIIVASGVSNVGGGTTAMKVIDLSHLYAIAAVDESDIRGVVPGVKAIITADAFKGMEFSGKVVRVATTGVEASNVVTFDVKVEIEGRGRRLLKPEMTTNITFLVDERVNVVTIPAAAVVRRAVVANNAPAPQPEAGAPASSTGARQGGRGGAGAGTGTGAVDYSRRQAFVTIRKPDGGEEERPIEAGITDGYRMEVVSGVQEGDTVVYSGTDGSSRWAGQRGPGGPTMGMPPPGRPPR